MLFFSTPEKLSVLYDTLKYESLDGGGCKGSETGLQGLHQKRLLEN